MPQSPKGVDAASGLFAALIVVFIFGFFVGLPVFAWVLLVAAFVGLWVATAGRRARERDTEKPQSDRPWRDNRDSEK